MSMREEVDSMGEVKAVRGRPKMRDYGIATDEKGLMDWAWVDAEMAKSRNYWICSTRPDGRPHAAPVWGVWLDGALYFGTSPTSRKARNLEARPEVVVHLESGDDTVIFEGTVRKEYDREIITKVAKAYGEKYVSYKPTVDELIGMWTLVPAVAMAWVEHDFPKTATRWDFEG
jgi:nitroimidazol reductase NimA-like FMN-containing flavoprotein (pyridoxamine 5'-phosphate oxidase superfamily)